MAKSNLKLVYSAPVASPRPYQTYYYQNGSKDSDWSRIGRAASPIGALSAAFKHLLRGHAQRADVYGEDGVRMYRMTKVRNKIVILGHFKPLEDVES